MGSQWKLTALWWRSLSSSLRVYQSSPRRSTGTPLFDTTVDATASACKCTHQSAARQDEAVKKTAGSGHGVLRTPRHTFTTVVASSFSSCSTWLMFNHSVNIVFYLELLQITMKSLLLMNVLSCYDDSQLRIIVTLSRMAPVLILCLHLCHALFSLHDWLINFMCKYALELHSRCCRSSLHLFLSEGKAGLPSEFTESLFWQD